MHWPSARTPFLVRLRRGWTLGSEAYREPHSLGIWEELISTRVAHQLITQYGFEFFTAVSTEQWVAIQAAIKTQASDSILVGRSVIIRRSSLAVRALFNQVDSEPPIVGSYTVNECNGDVTTPILRRHSQPRGFG